MSFEFSDDYKKYIRSPAWKLMCQRAFYKYGKKCQACAARGPRLNVHHVTYDRFGRELLDDLRILCYDCHRKVHQAHRANRSVSLRLVTERFILAKRMGK